MKNPESLVTKSEAIAILSVTYTDDKEEVKLRRIEKILNQIKFNIRLESHSNKVVPLESKIG